MEGIFAKPDITFSFYHHGLLSMYLEEDYKKVNTMQDLIDFILKWMNDMETTPNSYRKRILAKVVNPLYQMITNRSYETKQFETI